MNYSNFSTESLGAETGNEAKRSDPRLLVRHLHEKETLQLRDLPGFRSSTALVHSPASERHAIFRRDGDTWTLSYDQKTVCLRDIKGLAYIARLLSQPDIEIHAIELARITEAAGGAGDATIQVAELENIGVHVGYLGDAGEMLDKQAKAAYRRRLSELRDEHAQARALGQVDRAETAEFEIDALIAELSRATGLGGRNRVSASSSERARQSVTRAIKSALGRIADYHPALAQILRCQIKTGTYCSYRPDPSRTIRWSLGATTGDAVSSMVDESTAEMSYDRVKSEFDPYRPHPFGDVIGLILEPSWKAGETKAETEEPGAFLNQIVPLLRGALVELAAQLKSPDSKIFGNMILLTVNSAPSRM